MVSTPTSYSRGPRTNLGPEPVYPDEDFHGIPKSLQVNYGRATQIWLGSLIFTFLPIRYSLIVLLYDAKPSELFQETLNKKYN